MAPSNDQRRPVVGTGVEKVVLSSSHRISRPSQAARGPHVSGVLVVDVSHHPRWAAAFEVRRDLAIIEHAPVGAQVRLIVGTVAVNEFMVIDLAIEHVSISVESGSPENLRQWITALREVLG